MMNKSVNLMHGETITDWISSLSSLGQLMLGIGVILWKWRKHKKKKE